MKLKPNTLYQYKGGGYAGCIWEWNYAVITEKSKFFSIYHSGLGGCDTKERLAEYQPLKAGNGAYTYDLGDPESLDEFVNYSNAGNVVGVGKALFAELGIQIPATCDDCGVEMMVHEMFVGGISGAGGVALQATKKLCFDCLREE